MKNRKLGIKTSENSRVIHTKKRMKLVKDNSNYSNKNHGKTISKTTSEQFSQRHFRVEKLLSMFSESLFKIKEEPRHVLEYDEICRIILGAIAKHGPLDEKKLTDLANNSTHEILITRDKVRSRLDTKNSFNLIDYDYVIEKKGKKIGNIKRANEKIYFLTLKGMLASLSKTEFDENYLVREHIKNISRWMNKYNIPEFAIQMIKYNLTMFMLKNIIEDTDLKALANIKIHIDTMNTSDPFSTLRFPQTNDEEFYEKSIDIHTWFRVYSQVLNHALRKVLDEEYSKRKILEERGIVRYYPKADDLPHFIRHLYDSFIRYWYNSIVQNQFQDESKFKPFLIGEELKLQKTIPLNIDNSKVNESARLTLEKHDIQADFDLSEEPRFFTDS